MRRALLLTVVIAGCAPSYGDLRRPVDSELDRRLAAPLRAKIDIEAVLARPLDHTSATQIALANSPRLAVIKVYHLIAEPVHHQIAHGLEVEAWGYNGVGGKGPYGVIDMGGMFTVLKIRNRLTGDGDPGWYEAPEATIAAEATADELRRDSITL